MNYYRGNFCGIHIPGAPAVPGGSEDTDLIMACLLDNYPEEWQDKFLLKYAEDSYTHLQRSWGHAVYFGSTLEKFIALSQRAQKKYGLYCDQWMLGVQEWMPRNETAAYWLNLMRSDWQAMLDAKVIDLACVSWQLDSFMQDTPGNQTLEIIKMVAEFLPQEIPLYTHWVNEALAWWKTGGEVWTDQYGSLNVMDRFTWWFACQPYLTGGHHQGDVDMAITNPKLYQDKMKDTLDYFCGLTDKGNMGKSRRGGIVRDYLLDEFESTGQGQFGTQNRKPWVTEDQGDLAGHILSCTTSFNGKGLAGYGNGSRMPNGTGQ